jgi:hypothetical protein
MLTPELVLAAANQDGWIIAYIPEGMLTPELVLAAVQSNEYCVSCIPESLLTPEIISIAIASGVDIEYNPNILTSL